jgi:hypothetical protein
MAEINSKNSLYPHRRVQEITVGERFEPRILESFNPVTQEQYRVHLQTPSKGWENHSLTCEPKQTSLACFSHNQKEILAESAAQETQN